MMIVDTETAIIISRFSGPVVANDLPQIPLAVEIPARRRAEV
jgi:hypothetical protein